MHGQNRFLQAAEAVAQKVYKPEEKLKMYDDIIRVLYI